ncbi:uncharacterized protein FOMMEDRAFT_97934 [Fomitiporia mediterranea MF3/22]|uniref:uncharacterized protein n=1 Tax=Fomitiporia mediterranea (strain MF3/22) TaxID=694068 RepID=UPI0004408166|nr:uncharacterized protein FOMMEDRAFT_97934 [Fomitiporia mediterranea MF3/22]EJC97848.1 hypothetical protein FOMMEDRAFT_97934 [Fomitiporia mediterranea MF3/22]
MSRIMSSAVSIVSLLVFALSALIAIEPVRALAVPEMLTIMRRDVWAPEITSPEEGDVWRVGETVLVTWSTEDAPAQVTNSNGQVVLRTVDGFVQGLGGLNEPLASNFSLFDGKVELQVPTVPARTDYKVVLFGDSGNESPGFTISNPVVEAFNSF